jgi:hypothetical protein
MAIKRKLQVFVSSTFSDLIVERQAAVAAILKAGHIPAGMELFTAGDKSQMKTIERWIDESDVYMLILGGRYGSVEKVTGLSYTELEYDYAVSRGKPTFAVVIEDAALEAKVKNGGTSFIERDNPRALTRFREKVLGNISSFFSDAKDVKLCVHESMSDYVANEDLKGWISAADISDIRLLQDELAKLREENEFLQSENRRFEDQAIAAKKSKPDNTDDELLKVLRAIKVKIPAKLAGGKETELDLFSLVYNNRDVLINGVTDAINASEGETFFFLTVIPKLQAHGLAQNEKVPGARYRRARLNKKGQSFFAEFEKRVLLSANKESQSRTAPADIIDKKKASGAEIAKAPKKQK